MTTALSSLCAALVLLVFAVSGLQKLRERDELTSEIQAWPVIGGHARVAVFSLLVAEISVPVLALAVSVRLAMAAAIALLLIFAARQLMSLRRPPTRCLCFGVAASPPAGRRGAARTGLLFAAASVGGLGSVHTDLPIWLAAALLVSIVVAEDAQHYMAHNTGHLKPLGSAT